jgi:hypothetical protein
MTVTKGRRGGDGVAAVALTDEEAQVQDPGLIGLAGEGDDDGGTPASRERTPSVRLLGAPLHILVMQIHHATFQMMQPFKFAD